MAGGAVHGKPYRAARGIGEWLRDQWIWIFGECIISGCDLRDLDGYQLFAVGAAFAARSVLETKEEKEAKTAFVAKMDEMCKSDEEVFREYAVAQNQPGAQLISDTPSPGEPGFTGSPGGLAAGIPGLKELPVG